MINFFKKYRDYRREVKIRLAKKKDDYLEKSKSQAESELFEARKYMLSKPCAIMNMELCSPECVHWDKGHVGYLSSWSTGDEYGVYYPVIPYCRLWKGR